MSTSHPNLKTTGPPYPNDDGVNNLKITERIKMEGYNLKHQNVAHPQLLILYIRTSQEVSVMVCPAVLTQFSVHKYKYCVLYTSVGKSGEYLSAKSKSLRSLYGVFSRSVSIIQLQVQQFVQM